MKKVRCFRLVPFAIAFALCLLASCSNGSNDAKSSNADLGSLSVGSGLSLSPAFSAGTLNYSVSAGHSVATAVVSASASDSKASVSISPSQPMSLSAGKNAVEVKVTAEDGTEKKYSITITRGLNSEKAITGFSLTTPAATGTIDENAKTVTIVVPSGTSLTALAPTITITGASVSPASGAAQNFSSPVRYTVTAADGSLAEYTVTVTGSQKTKVGVLLPANTSRWATETSDFPSQGSANECEVAIQYANNSAATQRSQADSLLNSGIDVLIFVPVAGDASNSDTAAILSAAKTKRVPVINYDLPLSNTTDFALYLGYDNLEIGRLMGRWLIATKPRGNYWLFKGSATDENSELFYKGSMEIINPEISKGNITVTYGPVNITNWDPKVAGTLAASELGKGTPCDAILAPNDTTAGAIASALKAAGKAPVPITGQDGILDVLQRIARGEPRMTIYKKQNVLVRQSLVLARKLGTGSSVASLKNADMTIGTNIVPAFYPFATITKENIDAEIIDEGIYSHQDIYGY